MKPRFVRAGETGAALLAVLLLVAVTGAIAVAAMERLSLSRAAALNVRLVDQARFHASGVEQLALLIIDDRIAADPERTTLDGGWNGTGRTILFPGGSVANLRLTDGGNCFNVNSVVEGDPRTRLTRRPTGVMQFAGLMQSMAVPEAQARRIAEAAADWADSDSRPGPGGAEDAAYGGEEAGFRTANNLFVDVGELRWLSGMSPAILDRLRPWLCALPSAELSGINVNTLHPDQAPLLAMLAPGRIGADEAARILARRPAAGWASPLAFWRESAFADRAIPLDAQLQLQVRTHWFRIDLRVRSGESEFSETLLVDSRLQPSRIAARRWGN